MNRHEAACPATNVDGTTLKPAARSMRALRERELKEGYKPRGFRIPDYLVEMIDLKKIELNLPNRDVVANGLMAEVIRRFRPTDIPLPTGNFMNKRRRVILSLHSDYIEFIEAVCTNLRNIERGVALEAVLESLKAVQPDERQLTLGQILRRGP